MTLQVTARPTEPIRAEHRELLPRIERLREVADRIGLVPDEVMRQDIDEIWAFLRGHLVPHAMAEDAVLYPARRSKAAATSAGCYGLHALVRTHFAKEEALYLPLLDEHLTQGEAAILFSSMEETAHRFRRTHIEGGST